MAGIGTKILIREAKKLFKENEKAIIPATLAFLDNIELKDGEERAVAIVFAKGDNVGCSFVAIDHENRIKRVIDYRPLMDFITELIEIALKAKSE